MDDLAAYLDLLGEPLSLASTPVKGVFSEAGEVLLDGVVATSPTAVVLASSGPTVGQLLTRVAGAASYTVRQVLDLPPDAQFQQLVLARR